MKFKAIDFNTSGEKFYDITNEIRRGLTSILKEQNLENSSGILHLFMPHTSCALTISEAFDPSAARDLEGFMKHVAPNNLKFITHTSEGEDDSPSHMKSIMLHQTLGIIVENSELVLGRWQGIYLAEFRKYPKKRTLYLKYGPDAYC